MGQTTTLHYIKNQESDQSGEIAQKKKKKRDHIFTTSLTVNIQQKYLTNIINKSGVIPF